MLKATIDIYNNRLGFQSVRFLVILLRVSLLVSVSRLTLSKGVYSDTLLDFYWILVVRFGVKVPVCGEKVLLRLLEGPVGRHEESDERQVGVEHGHERHGHGRPHVLAVAPRDPPQVQLDDVAQVEGVDQHQLVGAPEEGLLQAALEQRPAQARERCRHLQDQTLAPDEMCRVRVYHCMHKTSSS